MIGFCKENKMKTALITGVSGQDGSFLSEFLLEKGYRVYGMIRRTSGINVGRLHYSLVNPNFSLIEGDLLDSTSLDNVIKTTKPDEVYNLGAQSFVPTSWTQPSYTAEVTGIGVLKMLEAVRHNAPNARFYQASSSEMFGKVQTMPQNENTPFYPRSPYGVAKLYGHWITKNYRESYNMFACSGILFNHESERRGEEFVTRKITKGIARILTKKQECIELGNLDSMRDWGYARDYVRAMWLMLQVDTPDDYVIATGKTHSIREFCEVAFEWMGDVVRSNKGKYVSWVDVSTKDIHNERGQIYLGNENRGKTVITINPKFYRPAEVDILLGDASKAHRILGWKPEIEFKEMVRRMLVNDLTEEGYYD